MSVVKAFPLQPVTMTIGMSDVTIATVDELKSAHMRGEDTYVIIESPDSKLIGWIMVGLMIALMCLLFLSDIPKLYMDLTGQYFKKQRKPPKDDNQDKRGDSDKKRGTTRVDAFTPPADSDTDDDTRHDVTNSGSMPELSRSQDVLTSREVKLNDLTGAGFNISALGSSRRHNENDVIAAELGEKEDWNIS